MLFSLFFGGGLHSVGAQSRLFVRRGSTLSCFFLVDLCACFFLFLWELLVLRFNVLVDLWGFATQYTQGDRSAGGGGN